MILPTCASLLVSLSGCASFSSATPTPPPPADLTTCAAEEPVDIPDTNSVVERLRILLGVRSSELSAHRCADRWAAWYSDLARGDEDAR